MAVIKWFTPSRGVIHKTRSEHPQMAFASGYSRKNAIYRDVVEGIKGHRARVSQPSLRDVLNPSDEEK